MSDIDDALRGGDLAGAKAAAIAAVQAGASDARPRITLAEVLILEGDLERADTHLDAASKLDPGWAVQVAQTRQLIRAATWRRDAWDAGRAPVLVGADTRPAEAALAALVAAREGREPEPADDAALEALAGVVDGRAFIGWRDGDDRTAGVLEVLGTNGNYLWAAIADVRRLSLGPVSRPRDLVWRPAELDLAGGVSGSVYLPVVYHAPPAEMTDARRLGRETDWVEEGERVRGLGLRTWLVGEEALAPGDFTTIEVGG